MKTIYFDNSLLTTTFCSRKMFYTQIAELQTWEDKISSIYGNAGHRFLRALYEMETPPNDCIGVASEYYLEKIEGLILPPREIRTLEHLQAVCLNYIQETFPKMFHTFPLKTVNTEGEPVVGTEVEFSLPYKVSGEYEIVLCGTIDKIYLDSEGKIRIRDYKFTSSWDKRGYLTKAAHLSSLRFYSMMLKDFLGLNYYPAAELEVIFLSRIKKSNPRLTDVSEVQISPLVEFYEDDMKIFRSQLETTMSRWTTSLSKGTDKEHWPMDWFQCSGYWGDCPYGDLCKADRDPGLFEVLKEQYTNKGYKPLEFQN